MTSYQLKIDDDLRQKLRLLAAKRNFGSLAQLIIELCREAVRQEEASQ